MDINFIAPVNELGYGKVGSELVYESYLAKDSSALFPIGNVTVYNRCKEAIVAAIERAKRYKPNLPCIRIWHQNDMSMFVGRGPRIGFPIFEMDRLLDNEWWHLDNCDYIFVCSQWAKSVLLNERVLDEKRIFIVNLGYNPSVFFPKVNESDSTPYTFLNMGKWEIRKGHDILVEAFNKAFTKHDNVRLWMCNDNPFLTKQQQEEWESKYRKSALGNKITIIPRLATDNDVAHLMRQANCGIFLSRAEGWNLEASEMIACGKPVIMTDYAGQTEFIKGQYAVPVSKMVDAYDGKWFFKQGQWAEPDLDAAIEYMRYVYKNNIRQTQHKVPTWKDSYEQLQCNLNHLMST